MPRRSSNHHPLAWSDTRIELLKKLWEGGLSASQIAAELGNVTRNAVIGKIHRLGLSGRAKAPSSAAPRRRKARPAQNAVFTRPQGRVATALATAFDVEDLPPISDYDSVVPMQQRLSLAGLNEATCHWPIGDPGTSEFFFCGGRSLTGLPYCAHHSRVAYQPAADRRRQQPRPSR